MQLLYVKRMLLHLQVAKVWQKLIQVKEEDGVQNLELLELWREMTRLLQATVEDQDNETQQHVSHIYLYFVNYVMLLTQ